MIRQVDKSGFTGDSDMANADTPLSLRGAGAFCNPKASGMSDSPLAKAELKVVHLRFRS
jgi:hypothetical protein